MKAKALFIFRQLSMVGGTLLCAFIALCVMVTHKFIFPIDRIIQSEKAIYQDTLYSTQGKFDHIYVLHTIVLYGLALLGAVILIYYVFRIVVMPFFRWLIRTMQTDWSRYRIVVIFLGLTVFFLLLLTAKEYHLRHLGYYPASRYSGNDFSQSHPYISRRLLADSNGMNYFNPDSFHNHTDSAQFVVNRDGFPSWFDFDKATIDSLCCSRGNKKRKMLFLGDSFAEGVGASRFDKSFMEIYKKANLQSIVCNTGIGGMDPIQYRLVAEKFIPQIEPDEVVVLFCGWNDILTYERKAIPYLPVLSDIKNVGVIYNMPPNNPLVLHPDEAYTFYRKRYSLMETNTIPARICRRSCVSTQAYYFFNPVEDMRSNLPMDSFASYRNLRRIKELSDSAGSRFTIVFIPTPEMDGMDSEAYQKRYSWAFKELWQYVKLCPKGMIQGGDCSTSTDYHFNDKGQKKFADFLQSTLAK